MSAPTPPLTAFLDGLAPAQMRGMLAFLYGRRPSDFLDAAALYGQTMPSVHGENHVDNAGHAISAIVPGDCITCGGHVSHDGTFTPASSLVGRRVADAYDDSPCPITGLVTAQPDGEHAEVTWDGSNRSILEPIDALRPVA